MMHGKRHSALAGVATIPARAAAKRLRLTTAVPPACVPNSVSLLRVCAARSHVCLNRNIAIVDVPSLHLDDLGLFAAR
jgi:hypothetical protein